MEFVSVSCLMTCFKVCQIFFGYGMGPICLVWLQGVMCCLFSACSNLWRWYYLNNIGSSGWQGSFPPTDLCHCHLISKASDLFPHVSIPHCTTAVLTDTHICIYIRQLLYLHRSRFNQVLWKRQPSFYSSCFEYFKRGSQFYDKKSFPVCSMEEFNENLIDPDKFETWSHIIIAYGGRAPYTQIGHVLCTISKIDNFVKNSISFSNLSENLKNYIKS